MNTAHSVPHEEFALEDRPGFAAFPDDDYHLLLPWNYAAEHNVQRSYPLIVYLHGAGGSGLPETLPFYTTDAERQTNPALFYLPRAPGAWDYELLIRQIEQIKSSYRVDPDRVYLVGFSMGGSGSYALANAIYDSTGHLFAAIVRMVGQSEVALRDQIVERSAVWYHVGLADARARVRVARQAYRFLKRHPSNSGAREHRADVPIADYPGTTLTLVRDGRQMVKYTRYDRPVGHGISSFPFQDPALVEWLFRQSLAIQ